MTEKHIFESPDGLVLASLRGTVAQNPALRLHVPTKSVYTASPSPHSRIAVISGGGAGHEPAHAGYVGHGMLTSSVSGDIFASPSARQILAAIELAAFAGLPRTSHGDDDLQACSKLCPRDILIIINNYTGDRLNFGLAIEQARARHPDINIATILNADDVSLLPQTLASGFGRPNDTSECDKDKSGGRTHVSGSSMVGPRGLGGNILVCKVLGAYVAFGGRGSGASPVRPPTLARAKLLGDALVAHLRSVGATLGHCHVPGREGHTETEIIPPCEIELGLGLHNEPGVCRVPLVSPGWLVREMVRALRGSANGWDGAEIYRLDSGEKDGVAGQHDWIREGDEIVLFINNLGGVSMLEMGAVVEAVIRELGSHRIFPSRVYSAPYMTSLNAPGFSVSLVNVTRVEETINSTYGKSEEQDPIDVLALLDAPTDAIAWVGVHSWPARGLMRNAHVEEQESEALLSSILSNTLRPSSKSISSPSQIRCDLGRWTWDALGFTTREVASGVRGACEAVLQVERDMTWFDTVVGDGDCGETFAGGGMAILMSLSTGTLDPAKQHPSEFVANIGEILEENMGGTIGALFAIFFTAWSTALRATSTSDGKVHSPLNQALISLGKHTPARPGDRTVVDALAPLCASLAVFSSTTTIDTSSFPTFAFSKDECLLSQDRMLDAALKATKDGAESTRGMSARLGRACYVVGRSEDAGELPPDPGAWGVAAIVEGFVRGVKAARG